MNRDDHWPEDFARWSYRGWVRCAQCGAESRHPSGPESMGDSDCPSCSVTLRWTDAGTDAKGYPTWLWRVVE